MFLFNYWNSLEFRFPDFGTMDLIAKVFKPACQIKVILQSNQLPKQVPLKQKDGQTVMVPLFQSQDDIIGKISIELASGKKIEHNGIKVELIGHLEMLSDSRKSYDFMSHVHDLDVPGELKKSTTYGFQFSAVEMQHDTYNGVNVKLWYTLRVTISRGYGRSIVEDREIVVGNCCPAPSINDSIKIISSELWYSSTNLMLYHPNMREISYGNALHAEIDYDKSKYHLKDEIFGNIYCRRVANNFSLTSMHIEIIRRELSTSSRSEATFFAKLLHGKFGMNNESGDEIHVEETTVARIGLADGTPVTGESIPIRLFLSQYDLTPTFENIHNRFSVKYYLKLVCVDEIIEYYFREREIILYRLEDNAV